MDDKFSGNNRGGSHRGYRGGALYSSGKGDSYCNSWRPEQSGSGRGDYYERRYQERSGDGYYRGDAYLYESDYSGFLGNRGGRGRRGGRYQGNWGRGRPYDERRRPETEAPVFPADVFQAVEVPAHTKKLSAMAVDAAARMLYTGSHDGTVKGWNTETGQCTISVDVGGGVDSLLLSGGFLFVGVQRANEGIVKVWNLSTGQQHQLPGHKGHILCLHAGGGMLFSGGQDRSIRVWSVCPQANIFMSQSIITKEEGGHAAAVHCFQSVDNILFSGDRIGTIKVWDLATGKLAQSVEWAHNEAITQMIVWENFLLTSSSDGYVKTWQIQEHPLPNLVIKPEPEFAFSKDASDGGTAQHLRRPKTGAIFTMAGTLDAAGAPILMVYYLNEDFVRLYELPSFASRGMLLPAPETRCLSMMLSPDYSKGHMMMVGDVQGRLRIFGWNQK